MKMHKYRMYCGAHGVMTKCGKSTYRTNRQATRLWKKVTCLKCLAVRTVTT